jgi:hypothetical protein
MPQTIKEYLEQVRAAGGVPTFTNIGGENPALQPGPMPPVDAAGQPERPGMQQQPPAAYLVREENQPVMDAGGMVSRPETKPLDMGPVDRNDPYAMANRAVKNQFDELFKSQFPNREPSAGLSESEKIMFSKVVESHRNAYVDRFKYQLDQNKATEKESYTRQQAEEKKMGLTADKKRKEMQKLLERFDTLTAAYDPSVQGREPIEWAKEQFDRLNAATQAGPAIDPQGQPAGQGADPANPALAGGDPMGDPNQPAQGAPDPQEVQKFMRSLKLQYGTSPDGKRLAKEAFQRMYPMITLQ